ncbi:MAG: radical SAM protein [Candidatus Thiodiazotropha lotti]|nr:radical SAM protein [Candidatus Thiodiazotropha lotti]
MKSIRSGRMILTLMPSLACKLDCPHCYLTKEQRRSKAMLSLSQVEQFVDELTKLWQGKKNTQLDVYWYGGEPLANLTPELFNITAESLSIAVHEVSHTVLSSLVGVDIEKWAPTLHRWTDSVIQTSWDGPMRGAQYLCHQEEKIALAQALGLTVDTISVVNQGMIDEGAEAAMAWLIQHGIRQSGWLPMQRNGRNKATGEYDHHAPSMKAFSDFMISISDLAQKIPNAPIIGEKHFIAAMRGQHLANRGLQTLFLMPNGDLTMPDYCDEGIEFLRRFGNIKEGLAHILASDPYQAWCRKQVQSNSNPECLSCDISDCCLMEFWKPNSSNDDCMGASRYVRHMLGHSAVHTLSVEHFS